LLKFLRAYKITAWGDCE